MIDIFTDFETRSRAPFGKVKNNVGLWNYANHDSTLPMMLAYGTPEQAKKGHINQWVYDFVERPTIPKCPAYWYDYVQDDSVIFHAHNAAFEQAIYNHICVKRWGWPKILLQRWRCTMAKASAANQPKALGELVKRLGLLADAQKDKRGKELIDMLSTPTKGQKSARRARKDTDGNVIKHEVLTKTGKTVNRIVYDPNKRSIAYAESQGWDVFDLPDKPGQYFFREDPNLIKEFCEYNRQDVIAEVMADAALPPWREDEKELWLLDQEINQRGIPIDRQFCYGALSIYEKELDHANARISEITDGAVDKCSEPKKILAWLNDIKKVNFGDSLNKDVVAEWLDKDDLDPTVREVLELRVLAGGTAVAKYEAASRLAGSDDIAYDQLLYHSASTGRWGGRGIQPHNMKRSAILDDAFIEAITMGDHDLLTAFSSMEGFKPMDAIKQCVRGIIKAPEGEAFVVSDFAGIEARVLHWLVGNEPMLDLFRKGQDTYIHAALDIYGCKPEEIANWDNDKGKWKIKKEHSEKRDIGKSAQLGLGYGMGWRTFQANGKKAGQRLEDDFAEKVVRIWREANYPVTEFWRNLEKACKRTIRGRALVKFGKLLVWCRNNYLGIRLPSGRNLFYYNPSIDDDGRILYHDGGKTGPAYQGGKIDTYGAKTTENVVQGIARDLLVYSMFLIKKAGLKIIFHVHDEAVVKAKLLDIEQVRNIVHSCMSSLPAWAESLPLECETQVVTRYTK
jgi:DNA polymerase